MSRDFENQQRVDMQKMLNQEPKFQKYVENMHIELYKIDKNMAENLKFIYSQYQIGVSSKDLAKSIQFMQRMNDNDEDKK